MFKNNSIFFNCRLGGPGAAYRPATNADVRPTKRIRQDGAVVVQQQNHLHESASRDTERAGARNHRDARRAAGAEHKQGRRHFRHLLLRVHPVGDHQFRHFLAHG